MRIHRAAPAFSILAASTVLALAAGSIDLTDAVVGSGEAPERGAVVVDDHAAAASAAEIPLPDPLGGIGTFSVPMPRAPRIGAATAPIRIEASATLPGGDYRVSELVVAAGATLQVRTPATFVCSNPVRIEGRIEGAALGIVCDGTFTLATDAVIDVSGGCEVDALGDVLLEPGSALTSRGGRIALRAHGGAGAAGDVRVDGATVDGPLTALFVQAAGAVGVTGGASVGPGSESLLAAYGGDLEIHGAGVGRTRLDGLRIEAAGDVRIVAGGSVHATHLETRIRALGGTLTVDETSSVSGTAGVIDLGARGDAQVLGVVRLTAGTISVRSFEADVVVEGDGDERTIRATGGDITLAAARNVVIGRGGSLLGTGVNGSVVAHGGDVVVAETGVVDPGDDVAIWAAGSILVDGGLSPSDDTTLRAGSEVVWTWPLAFGTDRATRLRVVGGGDVSLDTRIRADDDLEVVSRRGSVYVAPGAALTTREQFADLASGDVRVVSLAGGNGAVLASGATLASGDAATRSGDVEVAVHAGEIAVPEEGFLLIDRVDVRRRVRRPEKTVTQLRGVLDLVGQSLESFANVRFGDGVHLLEARTAPNGSWRARGEGLEVRVRPDRHGGSRARLRVRFTGSVNEVLDEAGDGPLAFGLEWDELDALCVVPVSGLRHRRDGAGSFEHGAPVVLDRLRWRRTGDLRLDAELALRDAEQRPSDPTDVRVAIGDALDVEIPAAAFTVDGSGVWNAVSPTSGVDGVSFDPARGTLTLRTRGIAAPGGPSGQPDPVTVRVSVAGNESAVTVTLAASATRLRY